MDPTEEKNIRPYPALHSFPVAVPGLSHFFFNSAYIFLYY
jgi:hypothetical protein